MRLITSGLITHGAHLGKRRSSSPWSLLRHLPLQGCSQAIIILKVFLPIPTLNVFKPYPSALLHCSFASAVDVRQHSPPHSLASQAPTIPSFNFPDLDPKPRSQPPSLLLYCHPSSSLHPFRLFFLKHS